MKSVLQVIWIQKRVFDFHRLMFEIEEKELARAQLIRLSLRI